MAMKGFLSFICLFPACPVFILVTSLLIATYQYKDICVQDGVFAMFEKVLLSFIDSSQTGCFGAHRLAQVSQILFKDRIPIHFHFNLYRRPYLIPESENQGVCISLAYGPSRDDIVASFRPKIEFSGDLTISQPTLSASTSISGEGVRGSHVLYKRVGGRYEKLGATCANVSGIRLPKSAIVDGVSQNPLFASADEVTSELVLQDLPSLTVVQHLRSRKYPIRDMKYASILNSGLLSCLAEDSLQLFSTKLL